LELAGRLVVVGAVSVLILSSDLVARAIVSSAALMCSASTRFCASWVKVCLRAELELDLDELLGNASAESASAQRLVAFDRFVRAVCAVDGSPVVLNGACPAADWIRSRLPILGGLHQDY
jgi:hypothetical protein